MRSASADASMQVPAAAPARNPNTVLKVAGATVALAALAVACLIAGLLLGMLIGQRSSKDSQRYREVERKLDQV